MPKTHQGMQLRLQIETRKYATPIIPLLKCTQPRGDFNDLGAVLS